MSTPGTTIRALNRAYFLTGLADGTLLSFIPLYLYERGLNVSLIGVVLAAIAAGSLVASLFWAYLADHGMRAERIVVAAGGAAAGTALLLGFAGGSLVAAVLFVALAVARSPFSLLDPIALSRLDGVSRSRYARIRLRTSAGWMVSVVFAGALYEGAGVRLMPYLYAPIVAGAGLWVWRALKPLSGPAEPASPPRGLRLPAVPVAIAGFLVSAVLLGSAVSATQSFLVLRIDFLGGGVLLIGTAAALQALTEIPTMACMQTLTRWLSHRVLFAAGCAIYVVMFVGWAFVSDALIAALMKLAVGVAFALTYVSAVVITDELSPAHLRATGQAVVKSALFGFAPVLGSLGGGLVFGAFGARAMFLAATVVAAAAGGVALASAGREPKTIIGPAEALPATP